VILSNFFFAIVIVFGLSGKEGKVFKIALFRGETVASMANKISTSQKTNQRLNILTLYHTQLQDSLT
jgi:hypothetical protein